jgi:general secretion pathway protein C
VANTIGNRLNPGAVRLALLFAAGASAAAILAFWPETAPPPAPPPAPAIVQAPPTPAPPPPPALTPADVAQVRVYGTLGNAAIVSVGSEAQQRVLIGRQLLPGIVLESTSPDHIILARGGMRLKVPLLTFDGTAPAATLVTADTKTKPGPAAKAPTLSRAAFSGDNRRRQTLAFQLGLVREQQGEAMLGFRVRKVSTMPFFARAGLKDGDIVSTINGGGLHDEEKVMELADELAQSKRVVIGYLRDGQPHEAVVDFTD